MNTLIHAWSAIWDFKLSLLPVLTTYLLFDAQAIVRRLTRTAYVPIYFMFFPLGHSDKLYAQYFNEDDFYGIGREMTEAEKKSLRTRLRLLSIISMIFATVVGPWLCGILAGLYLSREQFYEFVWFLMIVKTGLLAKALFELHRNAWFVRQSNSFAMLCLIYLLYLWLIWRGVTKSFAWVSSNLESLGLIGVIWGLLDYAYVDIFINILVVALGTWAITTRFTDPDLIPNAHLDPGH
ncbi:hypothetical protein [Bradyrhizobium oligotrophicum]|uniref:hypothetical protein n=1 Tax=Bradyrhizobium oligotrophicum TaxID=44255 RepID=UPI003EC08283